MTDSAFLKALGTWMYACNVCENKAVAILNKMQEARAALIKPDGAEMLIATCYDSPVSLSFHLSFGLARPFLTKPVLRRFSGPRIGCVGASCFVDDFFLVRASGVHTGCYLNPLEVIFLLFRCVWWVHCLPLEEASSAFC